MLSLLRPKKKLECNSVRQVNEYSVNCRQILVVMSGLLETDYADLLKSDVFKR
jgi:hypothetical protein